jgi:hypothetical protein
MTEATKQSAPEAKSTGAPHAGAGPRADADVAGNGQASSDSLLLTAAYLTATADVPGLANSKFRHLCRIHEPAATDGDLRATLEKLLAGQIELPAVAGLDDSPSLFDPQLDAGQRDAANRAAQSPDVHLIQGLPGVGKTRLLAEIALRALERGQRVLVLAPQSASVDRVLRRVAGRPFVLALRLPLSGEVVKDLADDIRALTPIEQTRHLRQQALEDADQAVAWLAGQEQRGRRDLRVCATLAELASRRQEFTVQARQLQARKQAVAEQVRREADARSPSSPGSFPSAPEFLKLIQGERERNEAVHQRLEVERQEAEKLLEQARAEQLQRRKAVEHQQGLLQARRAGRWFTLAYWRARLQGTRSDERLEELTRLGEEAERSCRAAGEQLEEVAAKLQQEVDYHARALSHLIEAEIGRRQESLSHESAEMDAALETLRSEWQAQRQALANADRLPEAPSLEALQELTSAIEAQRRQRAEQLALARQWQARLPDSLPALLARLPFAATLVGGSLDAWRAQASGARFDLLVIDDADRLAEPDLLLLATRARTCVLAGRPPCAASAAPDGPQASPFHRLWQMLHCDPGQLPYVWEQRADALVCRLHVPPQDPGQRMEIEHLLDQPDVQLRILSRPGRKPVLAEVRFPVHRFDIERAKTFLYQNLQELPVRPGGAAFRWREEGDWLLAEFSQASSDTTETCVPLEDGVFEVVQAPELNGQRSQTTHWAAEWTTARLQFDRRRGWDHARARSWLRDRTGLCDFGRTSLLEKQFRAAPELAAVWREWLFDVPGSPPIAAHQGHPAVQFAPIHAPPPTTPRSTREAPRPHGLEIDLSSARQRQDLPPEIRNRLPARGFVNLAEARELVQRAQQLVRDHVTDAGSGGLLAAFVSWQAPQVELIRLLWQQAQGAGLANAAADDRFCFCTVADLREREPCMVFGSLSRSHAQRPLAYAENAHEWLTLLTSACARLLVLGDPEALERRCHCAKPLGKQDEATAALERALAARLLKLRAQTENRNRPAPRKRTAR